MSADIRRARMCREPPAIWRHFVLIQTYRAGPSRWVPPRFRPVRWLLITAYLISFSAIHAHGADRIAGVVRFGRIAELFVFDI